MRQTIFLTITKWWCACLDLCFEIIARPWKPEELPYRRMICRIFGQQWEIPKSFDQIKKDEIPVNFESLRLWLTDYTRFWLNDGFQRHHMSPAWPDSSIEYVEEILSEVLSSTDEAAAKAFRMLHQIGEEFVSKRQLAAKLGVDKKKLYRNLLHIDYRLRSMSRNRLLQPFAFRDHSSGLEDIVRDWKKSKQEKIWQKALSENTVPTDIMDRSVEDLELSVRSYNCLMDANMKTIGDILRTSEAELLCNKNFGRKSLNEIKEVLDAFYPLLKIGMLRTGSAAISNTETEEPES